MTVKIKNHKLKLLSTCTTILGFAIPTVQADTTENFFVRLKAHYEQAPKLEVFGLNYHYLGLGNPYQSWDYQSPARYMALRMVEIDLKKRQFFEKDIHHFPDGLTANRVQFQNDNQSLFYDKNGISLGRGIIDQGMNTFDELKSQVSMNLDFLAVTPLLEDSNFNNNTTMQWDNTSKTTTITHATSDNESVEYVFGENPFRLLSINNLSSQKVFIYDNYQTTNDITFARSILKYYDGSSRPSFVHRIDQLHLLDEIEPVRFTVPKGFGPIFNESDKTLISSEIAPDLYLVTSASALRNNLFKVQGNEITVFGGASSPERAEETINLILSQFPNRKISSVYVTHPHSDNIAGLLPYAKRGIPIRTDEYTMAAIGDYPPFSEEIDKFKFQKIEHNALIDNIEYFVLENSHSKRQSFVYFRDIGIIFQADFLRVGFDNSIPQVIPNFTISFIDFVRRNGLKINRIVSYSRNNDISVEVMNNIYDAY